ncbi:mechanosensitive ion channel family protein [Pontibacillus halophilus]|uniref:mechanosensitive ion channel family protein n=1 Tax=Pontibacillus halophilus TaxID=516704 RepID=UPI000404919D|nr:mechanosensitive ion channel family protein [Pontibacillus halophilus]
MTWIKDQWDKLLDYILQPKIWTDLIEVIFHIALIIGLALLVIRVGRTLIHNLFKRRRKGPFQITHRREMTLSRLLENMLKYIVYFAGIVMILETLGIPVSSLLAGAGIAGLAIGFGAQNLVKDIITGFFIIFEDQFSVGDYIKASSMEGFVEEIGIRTTKIKSWTGELHVIPNGNIAEITNYSMHNGVAVVDLSIAYEGQIDQAEEVIEELLLELPKKYEDFITVPELLGVQSLGSSDVILRVIAEVAPMNHWPAARILRKELKNRLDERGIEIPFPRLVMYNRQEEMEQATNGGVR